MFKNEFTLFSVELAVLIDTMDAELPLHLIYVDAWALQGT